MHVGGVTGSKEGLTPRLSLAKYSISRHAQAFPLPLSMPKLVPMPICAYRCSLGGLTIVAGIPPEHLPLSMRMPMQVCVTSQALTFASLPATPTACTNRVLRGGSLAVHRGCVLWCLDSYPIATSGVLLHTNTTTLIVTPHATFRSISALRFHIEASQIRDIHTLFIQWCA